MRRRIDGAPEAVSRGLQTFTVAGRRLSAPAISLPLGNANRSRCHNNVPGDTVCYRPPYDLTTEKQNQVCVKIDEQPSARTQLRLQSTVEGLSVAAVTYYVQVLIGHAAEALRTSGVHMRTGSRHRSISIPFVAVRGIIQHSRIGQAVAGQR